MQGLMDGDGPFTVRLPTGIHRVALDALCWSQNVVAEWERGGRLGSMSRIVTARIPPVDPSVCAVPGAFTHPASAKLDWLFDVRPPPKNLGFFLDKFSIFAESEVDIRGGILALEGFCEWSVRASIRQKPEHWVWVAGNIENLGRSAGEIRWKTSRYLVLPFPYPSQKRLDGRGIQLSFIFKASYVLILSSNYGRSFTLHQRIIFLKAYAFSRIIYIDQILPCPLALAESFKKRP